MFEYLKKMLPCQQETAKVTGPNGWWMPNLPQADNGLDPWIIYQNRTNHGVNFGSLFVLEKYMYGSLFEDDTGTEHDAMLVSLSKRGPEQTGARLAAHYDNYLKVVDWKWLAEDAGVTAIRLPIGYWHVNNGLYVGNTPYDDVRLVYEQAKPWNYVRSVFTEANKYGIAVIVDIHGLPGGANGEHHSGGGSSGYPLFFDNKSAINHICDVAIPFIVNDLSSFPNFAGLQVANEAAFSETATGEKYYYTRALGAVRRYNVTLPMIISDGWWSDQWSDWVKEQGFDKDIVIDTHVYRCFMDSDKNKSVPQLTDELKSTVKLASGNADFMVGEYSCVLDTESWNRTPDQNRSELVARYGHEQVRVFKTQAHAGYFFWALQFEFGDGGEWGFVNMTKKQMIPTRTRNGVNASEDELRRMINDHNNYWNSQTTDKMEHWRYELGLRQTVKDIQAFDNFNRSRIGRIHFWKELRKAQHILAYGTSQYIWEWEQGFDAAVARFNTY